MRVITRLYLWKKLMNYKKSIVEAGIKMLGSNLTVETYGNISLRDPETGRVYLTPSAMDYSEITEDDVVVCDIEGNVIEGKRKPTIEKELHLAVYRKRQDVNAVIHTHPVYSTAVSCMGEDIPLITDEAAQVLGDVCKRAKYALPGSDELAVNCTQALGDKANCCLLQSHGAICLGADLKGAFKTATVLEMTARIFCIIKACGKTPFGISHENISAMQDFMKNSYGR